MPKSCRFRWAWLIKKLKKLYLKFLYILSYYQKHQLFLLVTNHLGHNSSKILTKNESEVEIWLEVVKESCHNMMNTVNISSVDDELDPSWEYSSALFLCMTILTTIGKKVVFTITSFQLQSLNPYLWNVLRLSITK